MVKGMRNICIIVKNQIMADHQTTLRFLAEPTDVNFGGKVHGGAVMKWIDQAGYACAVNWCKQYAVTVYVGGIRFFKPVFIGNLVEIRARLVYTGSSSMHIAVDVFSKKPQDAEYVKNTHCMIIFVAVGNDGQPVNVPPFVPSSDEEKRLQEYAMRLMNLRKDIEQEMKEFY
jgi:acyl-CoA hydrolase